MSEAINKLQPNRTLYLRGASNFGAAAALYAASATGFTVSGVFRDPADFAVLNIYDADCAFEHPRFRYLPDFNLAGLVLSFNLAYTNLQPIDSPKFPTVDWAYLDVIRKDGTTAQISLFAHAVQAAGSYAKAAGIFTITTTGGLAIGDRITLWYQNVAFDFVSATGAETPTAIATNLKNQINAFVWTAFSISLSATSAAGVLTVSANPAGYDGNMVTMYSVSTTAHISANASSAAVAPFIGGSSAATWTVTLDFSALGIDQLRQAWLTFSPQLASGSAYTPIGWDAVFTSWAVADPGGNRPLKVAGPGSVRVEDRDEWCTFTGAWSQVAGFYSQGFARRTAATGDSVACKYTCAATHNLYLGTALYSDRAQVSVSVDGGAAVTIDTYVPGGSEIPARRLIQAGVAAGLHQVSVTVSGQNAGSGGTNFVFDFIEAAVLSDVPDAPATYATIGPAIDYDTMAVQLSPQRLMHVFDKLGCTGPIDHYLGVFNWAQRANTTAVFPSVVVTIAGTYVSGDSIFVTIGGQTIGKTVFPSETVTTFAAHLAYFINELFSGVWASAAAGVLTITARSPLYNFTFAVSKTSSAGTIAFTGALSGGAAGTWSVDDGQTPALNYPAARWHADLYAEVQARAGKIISSFSMELVNPPAAWAALYPDGSAVTTATGFGGLFSTQCAPGQAAFLAYQKAAYLYLANLQNAAGLTPRLQFGECEWWFFAGASGMAYYDPATAAAAAIALGRPLQRFLTPNDDPAVNASADANFLRNRLRDHAKTIHDFVIVTYAATLFEALFAYDVNHPTPVGRYNLGGRLNFAVNLPTEWTNPASGYLEAIRIEALDFGSGTRSLDLAAGAIALAIGWGWALSKIGYLFPVFNGGCPWQYEMQMAQGAGIASLTPFALDHICLLNWNLGQKLIPGAM